MQVTVAFNKDPSPVKVNLGVGAYRTEVSIDIYINDRVKGRLQIEFCSFLEKNSKPKVSHIIHFRLESLTFCDRRHFFSVRLNFGGR